MKRARKNGQVPCILYGNGGENVMLFASVGELDSAKFAKGDAATLVLNGEKIAVLVKEVQVNYMKSQIVHLDGIYSSLHHPGHSFGPCPRLPVHDQHRKTLFPH